MEEEEKWLSYSIKENIRNSEGNETLIKKDNEAFMRIKGYLMNSSSEDRLTFVQNLMNMAHELGEELTLTGIYEAFKTIAENND